MFDPLIVVGTPPIRIQAEDTVVEELKPFVLILITELRMPE